MLKNDVYRGLKDPAFRDLPSRYRERLFRYRVWQKSNGMCGICGFPVALDIAHVDHINPRSLGGTSHFDNFQIAHMKCNISKGNLGNNRPKRKKVMVCVRLSADTLRLIALLAEKNDIPRTQVVEEAVRALAIKEGVIAE